jgi:hypothetical protein
MTLGLLNDMPPQEILWHTPKKMLWQGKSIYKERKNFLMKPGVHHFQ